jgi:hypothetical protein
MGVNTNLDVINQLCYIFSIKYERKKFKVTQISDNTGEMMNNVNGRPLQTFAVKQLQQNC